MTEWTAGSVDLSAVPTTDFIEDLEDVWVGGVGTFGEPEAAVAIQEVPGYKDYYDAFVKLLRAQCGDSMTMYRAMTVEAYRAWRDGADIGPVGMTFRKQVAKAWKNLAGMQLRNKKLVVVRVKVDPRWVIMRGHPGEAELVVDANEISFHTLKTVK